MSQGCNGRVCGAWSLLSLDSLQPGFVCCLSCLLDMQLCRCLFIVVESAETGGGDGLDDLRETRLQDLLREKAPPGLHPRSYPGCAVWLRWELPGVQEQRCLAHF